MRFVFALVSAIFIASVAANAQIPATVLNEELGLAARSGNAERVRELREQGADANARDQFGQPVILLASLKTNDSHHDDADHTLKDQGGHTALDLARKGGNKELVELLENPPKEAVILTPFVK
ncbi:MAG TPA: hypothetical protein VMM38_04190 [Aridibacter sp.]|nr:hypothetical protein [Aridibacter sp.]